eukprot:6181670-Pleurochrysis_carterae.AAC.1
MSSGLTIINRISEKHISEEVASRLLETTNDEGCHAEGHAVAHAAVAAAAGRTAPDERRPCKAK